MSFEHNSVRKKLFLSAYYCLQNRVALPKLYKNIPFGEINDYGDSYLHRLFCYSQLFKHDSMQRFAAGALRSDIDKELVYCYMIEQGATSCLLGPFTGLLFFHYVFAPVFHFHSCHLLKRHVLHCSIKLYIKTKLKGFIEAHSQPQSS